MENEREKVRGSEETLHDLKVNFDADFEYDVTMDHTGVWSPLQIGDFRTWHSIFDIRLISERRNIVKMIVTEIFIRTIFIDNFLQNIFTNLEFFSKSHTTRENREKVILGPYLTPFT